MAIRYEPREHVIDAELANGNLDAWKQVLGFPVGTSPVPEIWKDCEACAGQGYISETVHIYEAGCGFSHPDVVENPCKACLGDGGFICEAEGGHGR